MVLSKNPFNGALIYGCIVYEKKNSTDIQRVGAVLRHDVPIKRLYPLALQSSCDNSVNRGYSGSDEGM